MALASLDGLHFRINPSSIDWGYTIDTSVEETIGGRVVQVLGATLTDVTLSGEYGEFKGNRPNEGRSRQTLAPHNHVNHLSWELAEAFLKRVRDMMEKQSANSTQQDANLKHLDFKFPEYGWHFGVYIKGIDDGQSNVAIRHTSGTFAYKWRITLFIVEERSSALVIPSRGTTTAEKQKSAAINSYIARISSGVGWRPTRYNQPDKISTAVTGTDVTAPVTSSTVGTGTVARQSGRDRRLIE